MAEEKKKTTEKAPRKKPEPRPAFIGLQFPNHPGLKKDDIKVVFTTRKVGTILEAVTSGEVSTVVLPIKID